MLTRRDLSTPARPSLPSLEGTRHIPAIDGLRGLAVLLVVIAHSILIRPQCALDHVVGAVLGAGWCGVDLFFVLSGFLITGILFDAKGGSRYFSSFYIRRTLRIFPIYYAALVVLLIVLPRLPIAQAEPYRAIASEQAWFWLHLSNLHFAKQGFTGDATDVYWSLAIEEQFYLIWPLVVWWCGRRRLLAICATLIVVAFASRLALLHAGFKPIAVYVLPFARMDGLAAGALVALLARGPRSITAHLSTARRVGLACAIGLALIVLACGGLPIWGETTQMLGYSCLVGLFASMLVLAVAPGAGGFVKRLGNRPFLRLFGKYSYAIYIGHLPVRMALRAIGIDLHAIPTVFGSALPGQLLFTFIVVVCSLVLAVISWHTFEKHILKLKQFFPYANPGKGQADAPSDRAPIVLPAGVVNDPPRRVAA